MSDMVLVQLMDDSVSPSNPSPIQVTIVVLSRINNQEFSSYTKKGDKKNLNYNIENNIY